MRLPIFSSLKLYLMLFHSLDTFASKTAAIEDETADNSVGNVTGSNAVNVFLGIGIAWTMAAIYHAAKGTPGGFYVKPGRWEANEETEILI